MKKLTLLLLLMVSTSVTAEYKCSIKEIKQLDDNGLVNKDNWTKLQDRYFDTLIWNDNTRLLRFIDKNGEETCCTRLFDVIQSGTSENSTIAIHIFKGPSSTFVSYFRLETFRKGQPFLLTIDSEILSGNCKRV